MGVLVIACYRPKPGRDEELRELTRTHVAVLREQGLATSRSPIAMTASDGTIVEVFEWTSAEAIASAHKNPAVLALWDKYGAVCEMVPVAQVPGTDALFPNFSPLPTTD
jgi:hypothetical protein